jgi:glycosyltransferase involved in cell wall biosynthesis
LRAIEMPRRFNSLRIVFVQTGDFRAADNRISSGIGETYHAQKYSMEIVERLVSEASQVSVLCVNTEEPHDETLDSGVQSIGLQNIWLKRKPFNSVIARLDELLPTHLILRLPSVQILQWARRRNVRIFPCFADSFSSRAGLLGCVDRRRMHRLVEALNHASVSFIGNHNIAASDALAAMGVKPEKIVPWDWPRFPRPSDFPVKAARNSRIRKLIYVGTVSEAKGVGDIIRALATEPLLDSETTLDIFGVGEIERMQRLAYELGVARRIRFAGRVAHRDVAPAMHNADAVIVYSRHEYGEGLPGSIYLGLASRTPVVTSDHPMFKAYLRDGKDVVMVRESAPKELAVRVQDLFFDKTLYETLSANSADAFTRIEYPVHWGDVVERWLCGSKEDYDWLEERTLAAWRET